jgi:hypothetical protein
LRKEGLMEGQTSPGRKDKRKEVVEGGMMSGRKY